MMLLPNDPSGLDLIWTAHRPLPHHRRRGNSLFWNKDTNDDSRQVHCSVSYIPKTITMFLQPAMEIGWYGD